MRNEKVNLMLQKAREEEQNKKNKALFARFQECREAGGYLRAVKGLFAQEHAREAELLIC